MGWIEQAHKFAKKMADASTGLDRFQWLAILAALESLTNNQQRQTDTGQPNGNRIQL